MFRAPKLDEIINVKSLLDCEKYASEILSEIESSGVVFMGFDCEWVGKNKTGMIYISIIWLSDVSIETTFVSRTLTHQTIFESTGSTYHHSSLYESLKSSDTDFNILNNWSSMLLISHLQIRYRAMFKSFEDTQK